MRKLIMTAAVLGALAAPASAQNVATNNGIWWGGPAGGPGAFTLLNPLTTAYGRLGFLHAWLANSDFAFQGSPVPYRIDPSNGFGLVLGFGARLMPAVRYELQASGIFNAVSVITSPILPGSIATRFGSFQLMNNFYLDGAPVFGGLGRFNPYVMAGLGVSANRLGDLTVNPGGVALPGTGTVTWAFAWNAGLGLQYQLINNLILDVGYRYLDQGRVRNLSRTVDPFADAGRSSRLTSHQIMLSIIVPVDGLIRGFGN